MKCQVTSNTSHDVLISKEIGYQSFKELCSGEKKKVNLGFATSLITRGKAGNNKLYHYHRKYPKYNPIKGRYTYISWYFEVFSKFFSIHNIDDFWVDCESGYGSYNDDLGEWTGCMGKV